MGDNNSETLFKNTVIYIRYPQTFAKLKANVNEMLEYLERNVDKMIDSKLQLEHSKTTRKSPSKGVKSGRPSRCTRKATKNRTQHPNSR